MAHFFETTGSAAFHGVIQFLGVGSVSCRCLAVVTNRSSRLSDKTYPASLQMLKVPSGKSVYKVGVDPPCAQREAAGTDTFFRRGQAPSFTCVAIFSKARISSATRSTPDSRCRGQYLGDAVVRDLIAGGTRSGEIAVDAGRERLWVGRVNAPVG